MSFFGNTNFARTSINRVIGGTEVLSDDFSSDTWQIVGTAITISGGSLSAVSFPDNANHWEWKALGVTMSDTAWYVDFPFKITSLSSSPVFALTDQSTSNWYANGDGLGGDTSGRDPRLISVDGGSRSADSGGWFTRTDSVQYYDRVARNSSTQTQYNVYSDSGYTTNVSGSPDTFTVPSTIMGLDHIVYGGNGGGGGGTIDWEVLDVLVVDGVSEP